jgi:hypothetical protein
MPTIDELTEHEGGVGPNAARIRAQATLVVKGRIPACIRRELSAAVKTGHLGRLPKKGLAPEIFFHPDHLHAARERQRSELEYAVQCIRGVVAHPLENPNRQEILDTCDGES